MSLGADGPRPEVSVLLPTFNRAERVIEAVEMILAQELVQLELIVHDDGSTDETLSRLSRLKDERLRLLPVEGHLGIPEALNRLLAHAEADFIVFLHDHDLFDPHLLSGQLDALRRFPSVGFVNPGVAWVDDDGSSGYEVMRAPFEGVVDGKTVIHHMLLQTPFSCPITACAMVRRSALEAAGAYFDPRCGFVSDVDLWFRLLSVSDLYQMTQPLLVCRRRSQSHAYSGVNWQLIAWTTRAYSTAAGRLGRTRDRARARCVLALHLATMVPRGLAVNVRRRQWAQLAVFARLVVGGLRTTAENLSRFIGLKSRRPARLPHS